jgi:Ala-tRNA(Pro) deacylase
MEIPKKIIKFLEKENIKYQIIKHKTVYTAFDKSATLKLPEKIIGKTLILKTNGKLAMALIPASKKLDLQKIKKLTKVKKVQLVSEKIIKNKLKGVKIGAVPPFGQLWNLPVFIDRSLLKEKEIILNSGNYNFSIKISPKELKKLNFIEGSLGKPKK